MRKTAKSSRAPLAPLHNNSLRGESSRKAANENDKHTAKSFGRKATNKLHIAPPTKADKPVGSFPEARSSGSKTTKPQTPTKARKSVQLVTTSAVPARSGTLARIKQGPNKPAGAHVAKQAAKSIPSTVLQLDGPPGGKRVARQSAAPQSTKPGTFAPAVASQVGAGTLGAGSLQTDASPPLSVLSNWQVPATPPSISALLGTPEASLGAINIGTDLQYFPTHATPESAVKGVGTPQDFSDVFDLDEVSLVTLCCAASLMSAYGTRVSCRLCCPHCSAFLLLSNQ